MDFDKACVAITQAEIADLYRLWPATVRYVFALILAGVAVISVAAFIDACDTTGRAHDRAIISTTLALGGMALVLLWGRFPRRTWVPAVAAGVVAGGTLAVLESLQFGACLS